MTDTPQQLARLFQTTYDQTEWFVPLKKAIAGLSAAHATENINPSLPSIFEIVNHLVYWNGRYLKKMKGEKLDKPVTDNDLTFTATGITDWKALCEQVDVVFRDWTIYLKTLDKKDQEHFNAIANTCTHNAYHIGQIVFLRKVQGNWNAAEGVK